MKRGRCGVWLAGLGLSALALTAGCDGMETPATSIPVSEASAMRLPEPSYTGDISLEESLSLRRSIRSYTNGPLTLRELSQLLWAAQGITDPAGLRTAPSAGGTYPLELYAVVGSVQELEPGVYRYIPDGHQVVKTIEGDRREALCDASLGQEWVKEAAVVFVFAAVYDRTTERYGERGIRYVHIELGHAAENLCLQAIALGLGPVTVGAFHDDRVGGVLNLTKDQEALYVIPVGRP
jgi:SagB-type dehydrogenase family enzyme